LFWSRNEVPDLVYVVARFRVACILAIKLARRGLFKHPKSRIMVHDYRDREQYHVVEDHAVIAASVNQLVVLEPKREIDVSRLLSQLFAYQFDYWR
jgi:hypothetical protein